MRTHAEIIADAGGPSQVLLRLTLSASIHTVRSWVQRNSIPAEHWAAFAAGGLATLEELATGAAQRRSASEAA
ncbi:hypothetical protein [Brevundimonas sp.]